MPSNADIGWAIGYLCIEVKNRKYPSAFRGIMKKFEKEWRDFILGVWRTDKAK